jgi:hypothetical protein
MEYLYYPYKPNCVWNEKVSSNIASQGASLLISGHIPQLNYFVATLCDPWPHADANKAETPTPWILPFVHK